MRRRSGRRQSARTRRKISRSLRGRRYRRTANVRDRRNKIGTGNQRLKNVETVSKVVRNISLASESPSKIARNASVTARNLSQVTSGTDRFLNRSGKSARTLSTILKIQDLQKKNKNFQIR